jgi:hypothetical protein
MTLTTLIAAALVGKAVIDSAAAAAAAKAAGMHLFIQVSYRHRGHRRACHRRRHRHRHRHRDGRCHLQAHILAGTRCGSGLPQKFGFSTSHGLSQTG